MVNPLHCKLEPSVKFMAGDPRQFPFSMPADSQYEFHFECGDYILLFASERYPYEDVLHIRLLDDDGGLIEEVDLFRPHQHGSFHFHRSQDNCIEFSFWDNRHMLLHWFMVPRFSLSYRAGEGVHYNDDAQFGRRFVFVSFALT